MTMRSFGLIRQCCNALVRVPLAREKSPVSLPISHLSRSLTTAAEALKITYDEKSEVATMHLCRKPVNGLSLEFITQISIALEKLENERSCRGVIISSGCDNVFCAGLDINEMLRPTPERLEIFWKTLQDMWLQLFTTRLMTVAAITGHCIAGGCLISSACDHRVMAPNFKIGLNEVKLGIVAPFWLVDSVKNLIGYRQTEWSLMKGHLFSSEDALRLGLVDKVVPQDQVVLQAEADMAEWLQVPDSARHLSKTLMRRDTVVRFRSGREADLKTFVNYIPKESIQKTLHSYVESLKSKK
ncbi:hypothetical protein ScPMuIL_004798 [Solemya velum]